MLLFRRKWSLVEEAESLAREFGQHYGHRAKLVRTDDNLFTVCISVRSHDGGRDRLMCIDKNGNPTVDLDMKYVYTPRKLVKLLRKAVASIEKENVRLWKQDEFVDCLRRAARN